MKHLSLSLFALTFIFHAPAAVPVRWTVETSRAQPAAFEQYAGTEIDLEAALNSYGRPLAVEGEPRLYWQTNGMGAAWWSAPASASGNVLRAAWTPAMETGARAYSCFVGVPGSVYSAAFRLRLLPSPGAVPNALELPARRIDFAAVEVANAPWLSEESDPTVPAATNALAKALRGEIEAARPADYEAVKAKANSALQPAATNGLATSASVSSLTSSLSAHTAAKDNPHGVTAAQVGAYTKAEVDAAISAAKPDLAPYAKTADLAKVATSGAYADLTGTPTKVSAFQNDAGYVTKAVTNGLAAADEVDGLAAEVAGKANAASVYTKAQADARYYPAEDGALWASWWSGDGFRVAVSNYDVNASSAAWERLPAAAFEYRPGGTGDLVRVWDERTRWERARMSFANFTNDLELVLAAKADLDWGKTTPTGFDAPEGFTWLDTPAVAVAGGLAWQRTITSEGAIWLLCSNGMVAEFGSDAASTNGCFRITDERGETAFEIVQGDRRTVGANANEVFTWKAADNKTHLRVVYNVISDSAPTLHVADTLKLGGGTVWKDEGAEGCPAQFAGWTGSSGAWTNALWRTSAASGETDALFCYATYEAGGETVVKNHAPVALSKLVLGGVTYTVGTAEISGHTVLTLTPQGGE